MTRWWLAAAVTLGGFVVAGGVWLRRRWLARESARINAAIKPPTYVFVGHDDRLRKRSEQRRVAAAGIRARAAKVETGAKLADVLRMVRR